MLWQPEKSGETLRFGTMSTNADLAFLIGEANDVDFSNIIEVKGGKAVMNGVNAGDMDLGFMAGIKERALRLVTGQSSFCDVMHL